MVHKSQKEQAETEEKEPPKVIERGDEGIPIPSINPENVKAELDLMREERKYANDDFRKKMIQIGENSHQQ